MPHFLNILLGSEYRGGRDCTSTSKRNANAPYCLVTETSSCPDKAESGSAKRILQGLAAEEPQQRKEIESFGTIYSSFAACQNTQPDDNDDYASILQRDGYDINGFDLSPQYGGGGKEMEDWIECLAACQENLYAG